MKGKFMNLRLGLALAKWRFRLQLAHLQGIWLRARHVPIFPRVLHIENGIPVEIEYTDPKGHVVGHWKHGYFEPELPYQGGGQDYESDSWNLVRYRVR